MHQVDLRHHGTPQDRKATGAAFPVGAEHRGGRTLEDARDAQHAWPLPRGIPLFLVQGTNDNLVRPDVTRAYFGQQCKAGGKVRMLWLPNEGHGFAGATVPMRRSTG
jgi:pimeloyl-ACP methyl ester carboxylesterase